MPASAGCAASVGVATNGGVADNGTVCEALRTQLGRYIGVYRYYSAECLDQYGKITVRLAQQAHSFPRLLLCNLGIRPYYIIGRDTES